MKKYLFKAKEYGYGWYPATWQGWIITMLYAICLILTTMYSKRNPTQIIILFVIITALIIFICYKKGEKNTMALGYHNS